MIVDQKEKNNVMIKDDLIHCCPDRYVCNETKSKCENDVLIPWFTSQKATPLNNPSESILPSSSHSTIKCFGWIFLYNISKKIYFFF